MNSFKLSHFKYKDVVYRRGDQPHSIFLIIEGAVSFEISLGSSKEGKQSVDRPPKNIEICSISSRNFFGEEEIFSKKN